jgi:hypothetical protein
MPIALLFIAVVFVVTALKGTEKEFFALLKSDFSGPGNFVYWVLAFYLIAALGYFPPLKRLSNSFLALAVLALFISNRGFFVKFMAALRGDATIPELGTGKKIGGEAGNIIGSLTKGLKIGGIGL